MRVTCLAREHDITDARHNRWAKEHRPLTILLDQQVRLTVDRNNDVRSKANNQHKNNEKEYFYFETISQEL
jgi:hypothetical protein